VEELKGVERKFAKALGIPIEAGHSSEAVKDSVVS
jgi:hypothetical protein